MKNATIFENIAQQQTNCVNPIGRSMQTAEKPECSAIEPNHYAVTALSAAGVELRGWDFKLLDMAKTFAEDLRQKHTRVEIWAQDIYARTLSRRVPGVRKGDWILVADVKPQPAFHEVIRRMTVRDRIRVVRPPKSKISESLSM